jgi:hypothetical protein
MDMLFLLLTLVLLVGGWVSLRRRRDAEASRLRDEPWAASLMEEDADEPLDMDEARRAEDAFWETSASWDGPDEDDQGVQPYR